MSDRGEVKRLHNAATSAVNGDPITVQGYAAVMFHVEGISGDTITFEGTIDGTNWLSVSAVNTNGGAVGSTATADGIYSVLCAGMVQVRADISSYSAGTITVIAVAVEDAPAGIVALVAGEAHLGQVGGHTIRIAETVARPADTDAYAVDDSIADATSGANDWEWAVARANGLGGHIVGAILISDTEAQVWVGEVDLYTAAIGTMPEDNAEALKATADKLNFVGTLTFGALAKETAASTFAEARIGEDGAIRLPFECAAADTKLYGVVRTKTSFTPVSAESYTLILEVDQN